MLEIKNLKVSINSKQILKGLNLSIVLKRKFASRINNKTKSESANGVKCSLKMYLSILFMF